MSDYDRWRDQVLAILPDAEEQKVKPPINWRNYNRDQLWTAIVSEGRCIGLNRCAAVAWRLASLNTPGTPAHVHF